MFKTNRFLARFAAKVKDDDESDSDDDDDESENDERDIGVPKESSRPDSRGSRVSFGSPSPDSKMALERPSPFARSSSMALETTTQPPPLARKGTMLKMAGALGGAATGVLGKSKKLTGRRTAAAGTEHRHHAKHHAHNGPSIGLHTGSLSPTKRVVRHAVYKGR